jgi:hypothetical protein
MLRISEGERAIPGLFSGVLRVTAGECADWFAQCVGRSVVITDVRVGCAVIIVTDDVAVDVVFLAFRRALAASLDFYGLTFPICLCCPLFPLSRFRGLAGCLQWVEYVSTRRTARGVADDS